MNRVPTRRLIFGVALITLSGLVFGFVKRGTGSRASGKLGSAFYVWQRNWDDAVAVAVRTAPEGGLAPLIAEISWQANGRASVIWPEVDMEALRHAGRPVSAVLRIGSCVLGRQWNAEVGRVVTAILKKLRAGGIEPVELQVDFDCAKSQLGEYRARLAELRRGTMPLPVRPTVLPDWISSREFSALAAESGSYVLQAHATRKPRPDAPESALCEAEDARKWAEQAGKLGVPFRMALPTYTYRVAFAPGGEVIGIEAEGSSRVWPAKTVMRSFRPNPAALASLIKDWNLDRPACLEGLMWYRLPVRSDVRNWRLPTLVAVMQGRVPRPEMHVEHSGASPTDLVLVNSGDADGVSPAQVAVASTSVIADADGVNGYRVEFPAEGGVVFLRTEHLAQERIPPGGQRPLGWLRTGGEVQIQTLLQ